MDSNKLALPESCCIFQHSFSIQKPVVAEMAATRRQKNIICYPVLVSELQTELFTTLLNKCGTYIFKSSTVIWKDGAPNKGYGLQMMTTANCSMKLQI